MILAILNLHDPTMLPTKFQWIRLQVFRCGKQRLLMPGCEIRKSGDEFPFYTGFQTVKTKSTKSLDTIDGCF